MKEHLKKQLETLNQKIKEVTSIYHNISTKIQVSDNEFWVLYSLLVLDGDYSKQNICDIWSLPKQTVNSIVSNLKKKGYVFLETIPKTRNEKIIRLAEAGKDFGENTVLLHFCGKNKPWVKSYSNRFATLYKHYMHITNKII